jgi:hypothetical protein
VDFVCFAGFGEQFTPFIGDRRGRRFVPHWHQHQRVRVHFRQLEAWYRTLDQLIAAKEKIEVALYHRLRDLFSQGGFRYFENAKGLESEKGIEGKYVITTGESELSVLEVVAICKD